MLHWLELFYYASTGFGLITTGLSFVLGGEADLDADVDLDVDVDADVDAGVDTEVATTSGGFSFSMLPFASMRFWMFFADTFGITGILLTLLGLPAAWVLGISSTVGAVFGYSGFQVFRYLAREQVSGETRLSSLVGSRGRVLIAVRPGARGKVVVERMADRVEMFARSQHGAVLDRGASVVIVAIQADVAEVAPIL